MFVFLGEEVGKEVIVGVGDMVLLILVMIKYFKEIEEFISYMISLKVMQVYYDVDGLLVVVKGIQEKEDLVFVEIFKLVFMDKYYVWLG